MKHDTVDPPPEKSLPWQIWQAKKLSPLDVDPFAEFPCCCVPGGVATHPATGPWWHPAGLPKQEVPEIPPVRSDPWHCVQPLLPLLAM
jgi:hypothetical protein